MVIARKYGAGLWSALWGQSLWGVLAVRHGVGLSWLKGKLEGVRMPVQSNCHQNWREIVSDSEKQIRGLQTDWYWRQYFRGIGKS